MDSIVKMGVKPAETSLPETGTAAGSDPGRKKVSAADAEVRKNLPETAGKGSGRPAPAAKTTETTAGKSLLGEIDRLISAEEGEDAERLSALKKEHRKGLRKRYRLISQYVIATVVISYILLRVTDNLGVILAAAGRLAQMIGILLQPLFWGFVLAYILSPLVSMCEKRLRGLKVFKKKSRTRHTVSVAATCVAFFLCIGILLSIVISAVSRSIRVASLEELIEFVQSFAGSLQSLQQTITNGIARLNIDSSELNSAIRQLGQKLVQFTGGLSADIAGGVGQIGGFLTSALFALIFAIYFLLDGKGLKRYWNRVLLAVGGRKARRCVHVLAEDADAVFSGYIRGQLLDALFMAVMVSAALSLIGVRYAVIIGVLSGIGNLIPYLGPVVAYGSTILVCLMTGDFRRLLIALVVLFLIQTVDGNVINPKLLSSSVDVHPMLVIVALLVGGSLAGLVGMLFAVPVAAFFKIQFDKLIDRMVEARGPEPKPASRKKRKRKSEGKKE